MTMYVVAFERYKLEFNHDEWICSPKLKIWRVVNNKPNTSAGTLKPCYLYSFIKASEGNERKNETTALKVSTRQTNEYIRKKKIEIENFWEM